MIRENVYDRLSNSVLGQSRRGAIQEASNYDRPISRLLARLDEETLSTNGDIIIQTCAFCDCQQRVRERRPRGRGHSVDERRTSRRTRSFLFSIFKPNQSNNQSTSEVESPDQYDDVLNIQRSRSADNLNQILVSADCVCSNNYQFIEPESSSNSSLFRQQEPSPPSVRPRTIYLNYGPSQNDQSQREDRNVTSEYLSTTESDDSELEAQMAAEERNRMRSRLVDQLLLGELEYRRILEIIYEASSWQSNESIDQKRHQLALSHIRDLVDLSVDLVETCVVNSSVDSSKSTVVATWFLKNFTPIKTALSNYVQSVEFLNKFIESKFKNRISLNDLLLKTNERDVHSLLIKPGKQAVKYVDLLDQLLKIEEKSRMNHDEMSKALACMQDVVSHIGELQRKYELIFKYSRREKDQFTLSDKISKLNIHSMLKKSSRMSIRLSNILKLNDTLIVDENFTKIQLKFNQVEKLIKCLVKDVTLNLTHFKEVFKAQTVIAETILEYYGDYEAPNVAHLARINIDVFNILLPEIMSSIHEKVLGPLTKLQKYLETPNKLIQKRNDKLLDYEFAKSNMEKLNDRNIITQNLSNLMEAKQNFEALNGQLVEDLPKLSLNCTSIVVSCLRIYSSLIKSVHSRVHTDFSSIISQFVTEKGFRAPSLTKIQLESSEIKRKFSLFDRTKLHSSLIIRTKKVKSLLGIVKTFSSAESPPVSETCSNSTSPVLLAFQKNSNSMRLNPHQTEEMRQRLRSESGSELYKMSCDYSDMNIQLERDDLVAVIDKTVINDKWLVDNGVSRGLVPVNLLEPSKLVIDPKPDEPKYCIAVYRFESTDSSTLTVNPGEKLRVVQTHDDSANPDWWLLERMLDTLNSKEERGFVPSSYVRLLDSLKFSLDNDAYLFVESAQIEGTHLERSFFKLAHPDSQTVFHGKLCGFQYSHSAHNWFTTLSIVFNFYNEAYINYFKKNKQVPLTPGPIVRHQLLRTVRKSRKYFII